MQSQQNLPLHFNTFGGGSFIQCICSDPSHTALILSKSTRIFLSGVFDFQVLYGFMDVNGHLFSPKKYNCSNFVHMAIPYGNQPALFAIRDDLSTELDIERIKSRLREFVNESGRVVAFIEENKPISILLIKSQMDLASAFIQQQLGSFNLFPTTGHILGKNIYLHNKDDESLISSEEFGLRISLECRHREILQKIYHLLSIDNKCIVFLAGNKNVGKSTLARFLINALNTGTTDKPPKANCRAFLLDIDVGQSEFCPQGCVSLCEVNKPMLGEPFASQITTLPNSFFFGSNNPAVDFDFYIKLISHLLGKFHSITREADGNLDRFVLVVNSIGWIEDLGYDLMLRILSTLKPSILVNLEMDRILNFTVPQNYQKTTMTVRRKNIDSQISVPTLVPSQLRYCQMAGYLAQIFFQKERRSANVLRLAEMMPYRVRFTSISIYMHPELYHVEDKLLLCALNCSFIALCRIEDGFNKHFTRRHLLNDPTLPSRLELCPEPDELDSNMDMGESKESGEIVYERDYDILPVEPKAVPMLRCFGYGLIRAINPQRKLFYVLTPVDQKVLASQVNVFAYGHCMDLPEMLAFDPKFYGHAPYVVELDSQLKEHHKKMFSPLRPVNNATKRGFMGKRN